MPFSTHSHSGQFCSHAQCTLEDMVKGAIERKFVSFALTEHMPRFAEHRYPREIAAGETWDSLADRHSRFVDEALRIRSLFDKQVHLPIGFEGEFCDERYKDLVSSTIMNFPFDFFIGSLHHVNAISIDHDRGTYLQAQFSCGGLDDNLFSTYFDEQFRLLQSLRPPIVGHFDLIRLFSDSPDILWESRTMVWPKIARNLEYIASYDGIIEINTSAMRKGLKEPYPSMDICIAFRKIGGKFCLSDDSHSVNQIATNYDKVLPFLLSAGIKEIYYLTHVRDPPSIGTDDRFPHLGIERIGVHTLSKLPFWDRTT